MDLARDKNDTKMLTILSNYEKKVCEEVLIYQTRYVFLCMELDLFNQIHYATSKYGIFIYINAIYCHGVSHSD